MLRQRIIFTLIYDSGFFSQSRNFRLQKVGDITWLEDNYKFQDIAFSLDELVVLNATRGNKNILKFTRMLNQLVGDVYIPIAAGGGIKSLNDAKLLFDNGADKVVINSALYKDQALVKEIVGHYGKQSVVASVDYKNNDVYINNGTEKIDMSLQEYIDYVESIGVGEIYLNSIEKDGTGFGYDIDTIKQVTGQVNTPLIIAGGAGNEHHLMKGANIKNVSAVATANLFNFMGDSLPNAREYMINNDCNLVKW